MKNSQRQRILDKRKWEISEELDADMSGVLNYCLFCEKRELIEKPDSIEIRCNATQSAREAYCLCATAYNRSKRAMQKNRKSFKDK